MKIKVGEYEIYDSGSVIGNLNEPITFEVEDLKFEFSFVENKEKPEQNIISTQPDNKSLRIELHNFNSSLGTGNKAPLRIGNVGPNDVYINFRVYSLGLDTGKLFHYTFLLKAIKGGIDGK